MRRVFLLLTLLLSHTVLAETAVLYWGKAQDLPETIDYRFSEESLSISRDRVLVFDQPLEIGATQVDIFKGAVASLFDQKPSPDRIILHLSPENWDSFLTITPENVLFATNLASVLSKIGQAYFMRTAAHLKIDLIVPSILTLPMSDALIWHFERGHFFVNTSLWGTHPETSSLPLSQTTAFKAKARTIDTDHWFRKRVNDGFGSLSTTEKLSLFAMGPSYFPLEEGNLDFLQYYDIREYVDRNGVALFCHFFRPYIGTFEDHPDPVKVKLIEGLLYGFAGDRDRDDQDPVGARTCLEEIQPLLQLGPSPVGLPELVLSIGLEAQAYPMVDKYLTRIFALGQPHWQRLIDFLEEPFSEELGYEYYHNGRDTLNLDPLPDFRALLEHDPDRAISLPFLYFFESPSSEFDQVLLSEFLSDKPLFPRLTQLYFRYLVRHIKDRDQLSLLYKKFFQRSGVEDSFPDDHLARRRTLWDLVETPKEFYQDLVQYILRLANEISEAQAYQIDPLFGFFVLNELVSKLPEGALTLSMLEPIIQKFGKDKNYRWRRWLKRFLVDVPVPEGKPHSPVAELIRSKAMEQIEEYEDDHWEVFFDLALYYSFGGDARTTLDVLKKFPADQRISLIRQILDYIDIPFPLVVDYLLNYRDEEEWRIHSTLRDIAPLNVPYLFQAMDPSVMDFVPDVVYRALEALVFPWSLLDTKKRAKRARSALLEMSAHKINDPHAIEMLFLSGNESMVNTGIQALVNVPKESRVRVLGLAMGAVPEGYTRTYLTLIRREGPAARSLQSAVEGYLSESQYFREAVKTLIGMGVPPEEFTSAAMDHLLRKPTGRSKLMPLETADLLAQLDRETIELSLLDGLQDPSADVRSMSLIYLSLLEPLTPELVLAWSGALADPDSSVVKTALRYAPRGGLTELHAFATQEELDPVIADAAELRLVELAPDSEHALEIVRKAVSEDRADFYAKALSRLNPDDLEEFFDPVEELFDSENPQYVKALDVLSRMRRNPALNGRVKKLLADQTKDPENFALILSAMARIETPTLEDWNIIRTALWSKHPYIRSAATRTALNNSAWLPFIGQDAGRGGWAIYRGAALELLERLGPRAEATFFTWREGVPGFSKDHRAQAISIVSSFNYPAPIFVSWFQLPAFEDFRDSLLGSIIEAEPTEEEILVLINFIEDLPPSDANKIRILRLKALLAEKPHVFWMSQLIDETPAVRFAAYQHLLDILRAEPTEEMKMDIPFEQIEAVREAALSHDEDILAVALAQELGYLPLIEINKEESKPEEKTEAETKTTAIDFWEGTEFTFMTEENLSQFNEKMTEITQSVQDGQYEGLDESLSNLESFGPFKVLSLKPIIEAVNWKNPHSLQGSVPILTGLGTTAIRPLLEFAEDQGVLVERAVHTIIVEGYRDEAIIGLKSACDHPNPEIRINALKLLGRVLGEGQFDWTDRVKPDFFLEMLEDPHPAVGMWAARVIGDLQFAVDSERVRESIGRSIQRAIDEGDLEILDAILSAVEEGDTLPFVPFVYRSLFLNEALPVETRLKAFEVLLARRAELDLVQVWSVLETLHEISRALYELEERDEGDETLLVLFVDASEALKRVEDESFQKVAADYLGKYSDQIDPEYKAVLEVLAGE